MEKDAITCSERIIVIIREKHQKMLLIFVIWIVFIHLEEKKKLESNKKVFENKDYFGFLMISKHTNILEFNQCQKSEKTSFIIYPDQWLKE